MAHSGTYAELKQQFVGLRPTFVFELTRPGLPNEGLDCFVYGYAVRSALAVRSIDLDERERREPDPEDGAAKARPERSRSGRPSSMGRDGSEVTPMRACAIAGMELTICISSAWRTGCSVRSNSSFGWMGCSEGGL